MRTLVDIGGMHHRAEGKPQVGIVNLKRWRIMKRVGLRRVTEKEQ